MCLYLTKFTDTIPRIALRDITVYKVMVLGHYADTHAGRYYAPFRREFQYVMGKTHTSKISSSMRSIALDKSLSVIEEGLHAFTSLDDASNYVLGYHPVATVYDSRNLKAGKPVIVECVIPRGTMYYKGTWSVSPDRVKRSRWIGHGVYAGVASKRLRAERLMYTFQKINWKWV